MPKWSRGTYSNFPFKAEVSPLSSGFYWSVCSWNPDTREMRDDPDQRGESLTQEGAQKDAEECIEWLLREERYIWVQDPKPSSPKDHFQTLYLVDRYTLNRILGQIDPTWTESGYAFLPSLLETENSFGRESVDYCNSEFEAQQRVIEWVLFPDQDPTISLLGQRIRAEKGKWTTNVGHLTAEIEAKSNGFYWSLRVSNGSSEATIAASLIAKSPKEAALACNKAAKKFAQGLLDIANLDITADG